MIYKNDENVFCSNTSNDQLYYNQLASLDKLSLENHAKTFIGVGWKVLIFCCSATVERFLVSESFRIKMVKMINESVVSNLKVEFKLQISFQIEGLKFEVFKFQVSSFKFQVSNFKSPI
jgi:hypothetical protein